MRAAPAEGRRGLPLLHLRTARRCLLQVEVGHARPQPRDLDSELLGSFRRGRLQRQRPQPLPHLRLDVPRPLDLDADAVELQLRAVLATLELAEAGRLLDELAPLLGPGREHRLDLALADDRVHRAAQADVGEQLDEVGAAHARLVDEVLALAAAVQAARDRDLGEVQLRSEATVGVVEDELDLAALRGLASLGAVEEDVVRLLRAQLRGRQRAGGPDDRVGDVRLARSVRPDDDGDAGLELQLEGIGKRLEAAQTERAQVHPTRLAGAADGVRDAAALPYVSSAIAMMSSRLIFPTSSGCAAPTCVETF